MQITPSLEVEGHLDSLLVNLADSASWQFTTYEYCDLSSKHPPHLRVDLPVTVAVLPVPVEGFEMTLDDLQSLIDEDVVARGAALCMGRALASDGPLPSHLRFDVVSVRVHHVRGAWQS